MNVMLEKSFPLPVSAELAWQILCDIEAVASCMPGARITDRIDGQHYKGMVLVKLGPASMSFRGQIEVKSLDSASWRQRHPEQIEWLDTDNRHYTTDLDTPEDLQRFEAETGHALIWPGTVDPLASPAPATTPSALASGSDKPVNAA